MAIVEPLHLILPADLADHALPGVLAPDLACESGPTRRRRRRFFDTLDWRLHVAGLALERGQGSWRLTDLASGVVVAQCATWAGPWPRFAAAFPSRSELRDRLEPLLGSRALLPVLTVVTEARVWRFRDELRAIALTAESSTHRVDRPAGQPLLRVATIHSPRGHAERAAAAAAAATARGATAVAGPVLDLVFAAAGVRPEHYRAGLRVELDPAATAHDAAVRIGRALLQAIRANEPGVRADLDPEFLHDLRVAVRRLRTALGQLADVFPAAAIERFEREFAAVGRATGALRDLDVFLRDEATYRALVPPPSQPGLATLYEWLRAQRHAEWRRLRRILAAPAHQRLLAEWETFLNAAPAGPAAGEPARDLARSRLARRYRRLLRRGRAIDAGSPERALHRLRIDGKKVRYLLEFFASLFPPDDVAGLLARLKGLQDNLGEANDLGLQQRRLRERLAALSAAGEPARREAAALTALIAALGARQAQVRADFAAAFAAFADRDVHGRFRALCGEHLDSDASAEP